MPGKSAVLSDIQVLPSGEGWAVGMFTEYPVYEGVYTLPQTLVLGGSGYSVSAVPQPLSLAPTLGPATPNPMSDQVSFSINLPNRSDVELGIYDVSGRTVHVVVSGMVDAGVRTTTWNGRDAGGQSCGPGVYFARLAVDGRIVGTRTIALLSRSRDR